MSGSTPGRLIASVVRASKHPIVRIVDPQTKQRSRSSGPVPSTHWNTRNAPQAATRP